MENGIFENLALDDSGERQAGRTALRVAHKRVKDNFGAFLAESSDVEDHKARLDLVSDNIKETVQEVVNEYGGDPTSIEASLFKHLADWVDESAFYATDKDWDEAKTSKAGTLTCPSCGSRSDSSSEKCENCGQELEKMSKMAGDDQGPRPLGWEGQQGSRPPWDPQGLGIDHPDMDSGEQEFRVLLVSDNPYLEQEVVVEAGSPEEAEAKAQQENPGAGEPVPEETHPLDNSDLDWHPSDRTPRGGPEPGSWGQAKVARKPKLCPYHSEVVDISLASADPRAGFDAMSQHAWGPQHCQGHEYEGRCNFQREMVTTKYWDDKKQQAEERRELRDQQRQQERQDLENLVPIDTPEPEPEISDEPGIEEELAEAPTAIGEGAPSEHFETEDMAPALVAGVKAPASKLATYRALKDAELPIPPVLLDEVENRLGVRQASQKISVTVPFSASGDIDIPLKDFLQKNIPGLDRQEMPVNIQPGFAQASKKQAEALETVDVTQGSPEDPSPEMDKTRWKPNALNDSGNIKPIDSEGSGSPVPTEQIDVMEAIEYDSKGDFLDQTKAVTEQETLPTANEDGHSTEKNIEVNQTDTWNGNNGASPVTTEVQSKIAEEFPLPEDRGEAFGEDTDDPYPSVSGGINVTPHPQAGLHNEVMFGLHKLNGIAPGLTMNGEPFGEKQKQELLFSKDPVNIDHPDPKALAAAKRMIEEGTYRNVLKQGAEDPDKNPIRQILEEGFVPQNQVEEIIQQHEASGNFLAE